MKPRRSVVVPALRSVARRCPAVLAGGLVLAMGATPAWAQSELRPPKITENPSSPKFWMYAVLVLILAAVVFAASFKPKRTHQD